MDDFKITIPTPCPKDWDEMSPANGGRHCYHCDKVVVDFTTMSPDGIKNYFIAIKNERVCGHFKTEQVSNSDSTFLHRILNRWHQSIEQKISLPFMRTALLFLLGLCMILTGCHRHPHVRSGLTGRVSHPIPKGKNHHDRL